MHQAPVSEERKRRAGSAQPSTKIPKVPSYAKPQDWEVKGHILKTDTAGTDHGTAATEPKAHRCSPGFAEVALQLNVELLLLSTIHKG